MATPKPSTAKGRDDKRDEKRRAILEAACAVFTQKGFHRARVEEIAVRAGVGKGTIYEYFPSKKDLYEEMVETALGAYAEELAAAVAARDDPRSKLLAAARCTLMVADRNRALARLILEQPGGLGENLRRHIWKVRESYIQILRGVVEEGIAGGDFRPVDPHLAAMALVGAYKSVFLQRMFGDKPFSTPDEAARQVLDLLVGGLEAKRCAKGGRRKAAGSTR